MSFGRIGVALWKIVLLDGYQIFDLHYFFYLIVVIFSHVNIVANDATKSNKKYDNS